PRVNGWFMMSSPWPCLMIMLMYLILVKVGPTIMKNRKPLELKNVLLSYNIGLVFLSGYCFTQIFFRAYVFGGISFGCEAVDYSDSPNNLALVGTGWLFYISKLLEMLDTIQFVLILLHSSQLLFIDCGFPRPMAWIFVIGSVTFILLFSNFYIQAYLKNTNKKQLDNRASNGHVKEE
ncbi:Hypothetical predicted protein, partial [Mytilus galloprovincialis]